MRKTFIMLASAALMPAPVAMLHAQMDDPPAASGGPTPAECERLTGVGRSACFQKAKNAARQATPDCSTYSGVGRSACLDNAKKAEAAGANANGKKGTPGVSKADALLVNSTNAAAQAKLTTSDFAGAAAEYQKGIDASPTNPAKHILYAGLAMSLRRQGVAAYNSGEKPAPPPPGASNDTIRAFNVAVAQSQATRTAVAVPLFKRALEAAATAATAADASANKAADPAISLELRESAALMYALDRTNTLTVARPSAELEATWLRRWLTATNPLAESLAAKYGIAVAANLVAKDPAAGLTLADEVKARTGADADGAIGFAEIVVAAKTPASDPHRATALTALTAAEATVVDSQQKKHVAELKAALGKPA